jgi:chemotaxis protein methyltransferase CheR
MQDDECINFLQWALPRLDLAWPGFRKVRGQVCKRLKRRMHGLGIERFADYRARLEAGPEEWRVLDGLCRITISRFCRDRSTFDVLRHAVLPQIAMRAAAEEREARIWSAGCASGEEPYTIRILWDFEVMPRFPDAFLGIVATDIDEILLDRAERLLPRSKPA